MRTMKILALSTLVVGFMATSAFAGDCGSKTTEAKAAKAETAMTKAGGCDSGAKAAAAKTAKAGGCDSSAKAAAAKTAKAGGCEGSAKAAAAKTAKAGGCDSGAKAAAAKTAKAGGCEGSAKAAAAKTAKAGGCDSGAKAAATKTAKAGGCDSSAKAATATKVAGAGCATSATKTASMGDCESTQAKMAKAVKLETVRMPSGAMAVFYHGKNAEAVAYLQKSAESGCQGFACDLAKNLAADENCTVEMAKTESGVMMLVTSEKADVVDQYEARYAAVMESTENTQGE
jgi:hypothetical protein